jgi:formate dehydrogenase subunit gamma
LVIVLITSGIVIWEQYFSEYFSIMQKRIAVLMHSIAAIMAICVWIVLCGDLGSRHNQRHDPWPTGGWAWRHHRRWLRDREARRLNAIGTAPDLRRRRPTYHVARGVREVVDE